MQIGGGLIGWLQSRKAEFRLSVRVSVAALTAYTVATLLDLPQGYWAVFTAILVVQASVGGSVKTGIDWFIGTVGGAIVGVIVATVLSERDHLVRAGAIALVVAPLAFLAAVKPVFRVAPLTAVIVVLGLNPDLTPAMSAFDRVLEIAVGSLIGVAVSLTVLPARAHGLTAAAAADALDVCAALLNVLLEAVSAGTAASTNEPLHAAVRRALSRVETLAEEAGRERATRLSTEPDPSPLPRTLRRLRNDLVMINRAASAALPADIAGRIAPAVTHVARATVAFMGEAAAALRARGAAPSLEGVAAALDEYGAAMALLRRDGLIRPLSDDDAGRVFALGFALDQLQANFKDLANRISERARHRA